jgi:hypothetical protein
MQAEDPPQSLNQKEKAQWSTSWAGLPKTAMSTEPIVPKNMSAIPNNKVMYMG